MIIEHDLPLDMKPATQVKNSLEHEGVGYRVDCKKIPGGVHLDIDAPDNLSEHDARAHVREVIVSVLKD